MNTSKIFTPLVLSLLLTACATSMPTAHSGFLSSYARLAANADGSRFSAPTTVPIDPTRIDITEVLWKAPADAAITNDERALLLAQLRSELGQQFQRLPTPPGARLVKVRAAITRAEAVSPALNTVTTVLLFAPLDRGGAAVELEATDARTGQQLAALTFGEYAPMGEFKARFTRLAPAEFAVKKAAEAFADLLQVQPER